MTEIPRDSQHQVKQNTQAIMTAQHERISALTKEIEKTNLATYVFERFYNKMSEVKESAEDRKSLKKRNTIRQIVPQTLNGSQKYDIANVIQDDITGEIATDRNGSEKTIDTLRAVLEETQLRLHDMKREAFEFKRDVVVGGINPRSEAVMVEKIESYYDAQSRAKDVLLEKLRLKNGSMKRSIVRNEHQLALREEAGEILHYIDFHQLQIENKQYSRKIEEKERELSMQKNYAGKGIRILNYYKKAIAEATEELVQEKAKLDGSGDFIKELHKEAKDIRKYIRECQQKNNELKTMVTKGGPMPEAIEFILQKKESYEVFNELKVWQKRVDLSKQGEINSRQKKRAALKEISGNANILRSSITR